MKLTALLAVCLLLAPWQTHAAGADSPAFDSAFPRVERHGRLIRFGVLCRIVDYGGAVRVARSFDEDLQRWPADLAAAAKDAFTRGALEAQRAYGDSKGAICREMARDEADYAKALGSGKVRVFEPGSMAYPRLKWDWLDPPHAQPTHHAPISEAPIEWPPDFGEPATFEEAVRFVVNTARVTRAASVCGLDDRLKFVTEQTAAAYAARRLSPEDLVPMIEQVSRAQLGPDIPARDCPNTRLVVRLLQWKIGIRDR